MGADQSPIESPRPIQFDSAGEEVAVGVLMGSVFSAIPTVLFSGLVGAVGAKLGDQCGDWPVLGGSLFLWVTFWVLPLKLLMKPRLLWLLLAALAGAAYLGVAGWYLHQRDLGTFYPWILTTLPFGIVLGAVIEPIRLASGGSTASYAERSAHVGIGGVFYGNRSMPYLTAGAFLGLVANVLSWGRERIGAPIAGFLAGGLAGAAPSALVAWCGDDNVAELFLGNVWNVAWAGIAVGAVTGAVTGHFAAAIREKQQQILQRLHETAEGGPPTPPGHIKEVR